MNEVPRRSVTQRGFITYDEFPDSYGAEIVVRESSLATEDCLWVFTEGGGVRGNNGSCHLNAAQAVRLRNALDTWLTEHGHLEEERSSWWRNVLGAISRKTPEVKR